MAIDRHARTVAAIGFEIASVGIAAIEGIARIAATAPSAVIAIGRAMHAGTARATVGAMVGAMGAAMKHDGTAGHAPTPRHDAPRMVRHSLNASRTRRAKSKPRVAIKQRAAIR
jgi:hypothetical protein